MIEGGKIGEADKYTSPGGKGEKENTLYFLLFPACRQASLISLCELYFFRPEENERKRIHCIDFVFLPFPCLPAGKSYISV
jgi:hypothetical protein